LSLLIVLPDFPFPDFPFPDFPGISGSTGFTGSQGFGGTTGSTGSSLDPFPFPFFISSTFNVLFVKLKFELEDESRAPKKEVGQTKVIYTIL
jgi:hypothetical protein